MSLTSTLIRADATPSYMSSSISSLASNQPPSVARVYKQSFQLFITRRTREGLDTLEPILRPASTSPNRLTADASNHTPDAEPAPIALASKNARVKVWNLYIAILNAAVELGIDEGKRAFGAARWKKLALKTRDGSIWEEVVRHGYGGKESAVDPEVVASLATLLIAHAPVQKLTQQRLETYLSTLSPLTMDSMPDSDTLHFLDDGVNSNKMDSVKELNARLKIIEIFTLHVLPRNEEWDYAREFINMSEVITQDKKEAFLQTLQAIHDKPQQERHERELQKQREQEVERKRREQQRRAEDERRHQEEERRREERAKEAQRQKAEVHKTKQAQDLRETQQQPKSHETQKRTAQNGTQQDNKAIVRDATIRPPDNPSSSNHPKNATIKSPRQATPPAKGLTPRATGISRFTPRLLFTLQHTLLHIGQGLSKSPLALLRTVLFLIALITALARRDVRDRIFRAQGLAWDKLKRTVGMGVKVSYI